ncbi:MAG TPA: cellulase family glycosylhydrolase [Acidimicrobiales bacterium]|nr:cellulase family glycosylhydrolase [Acidimicrobiales bacterium]
MRRALVAPAIVAIVAVAIVVGLGPGAAGGAAAASYHRAAPSSSPSLPASHGGTSWCSREPSSASSVTGCVTAPGGPWLRDSLGRALVLHGVNAVFKVPPYEFTQVAGEPDSLTASDAKEMASLGFDVVRLGIIWKGLEPGTLPVNSARTCTEGIVSGSGTGASQLDATTLDDYLARLRNTIDLLGSYGIYSLVDMHQDVYNELFAGEGAPNWAVCTNGIEPTNTGNWSANYFTPAVGLAYDHFWDNDVAGGLQQNYDRVWAAVASYLRNDPSVIGYDVFNEPFSTDIATAAGNAAFDSKLECFYTGTAHAGEQSETDLPLACPPTDPAQGAVASIEESDPDHLVFYEPDVGNDFGETNWIGPMPFGRLVLDFHDYCLASAGQAYYDFYGSPMCSEPEQEVVSQEQRARADAATPEQPGGPAWFMSEFGSGEDTVDLGRIADLADQNLLSWTYWQWKLYDDPTGGSTEALVSSDGALDKTKAQILVRPYAQAVAGTPVSMSYDPTSKVFELSYSAAASISAPTVVYVPVESTYDVYPSGYCVRATGATVSSAAGAAHLLLRADPGAGTVSVKLGPPGEC